MQWADVLALAGDAADNIPGVKGVGIKTAPKLLQQFGDLETLLARADEVEKKVCISMHNINPAVNSCFSGKQLSVVVKASSYIWRSKIALKTNIHDDELTCNCDSQNCHCSITAFYANFPNVAACNNTSM